MLRKLSVKNFRLLRDVTIDVEPGKPIVLIGPNGSGKSSVIQALDLASRWAEEGFEAGCRALGGVESLLTTTSDAQLMRLAFGFDRTDDETLRHRYTAVVRSPGQVAEELLDIPDIVPEFEMKRIGAKLTLWNERDATLEDQRIPLEALSFDKVRHPEAYPGLGELQRSLAKLRIYDGFLTTPLWTRDVREGTLSPFDSMTVEPVARLHRRGLDLINALYYIQQNYGETWDDLMAAFRAEFPFVQRIEFPADPAGGRIALAFRDKRYPGIRMHGHQMSEGMTTYLCLLAAILSPEPATALAFDEPDRHLHPSALRRIAYLLERASEKTAVFVATHSDRFLDYLSDPAGSIRICEPTAEGVKLRMLNRDALEEWRTLYSLSALRERGQLDPENSAEIDP